MTLPSLYIPHGGGPCFFMPDPNGIWTGMAAYLRSIAASLPEPPADTEREAIEALKPLQPHALGSLTWRQRDVFELLRRGKSNRDIGAALGLTEGTVKVHITAIFKALGARNRTHAVMLAGPLDEEG